MEVNLEFKNYNKIKKDFKGTPKQFLKTLKLVVKKAAFLVERESKRVTPVDTGRLRASIYTTLKPTMATVQPKTNYAYFVHEGTSRTSGRPFMRIGLENAEEDINKMFNKEFDRVIKKI